MSRRPAKRAVEPAPQPEQRYTYTQAAQLLACAPQTIRNKVALGLLPRPIETVVGPRFTASQLARILAPKPRPHAEKPKRPRGRPRIALKFKGGAE